ncbi:MAG TPA: SWIM zinc finger family protein [Phototrophicaceae bacterium]|nr:SWIM zinc finger family protein [Phototrophicaceae bacterium]
MTPEQVLALSDNESIQKNGQKLARTSQWKSLNANERAVWGEIKGSGKEPYQVRFDLHDNAYKCSCPSRPQPCKHTLALILLYVEEPAAFGHAEPPTWVTTWLAAHDAKAEKKAAAQPAEVTPDTAAQSRRIAEREAKISAGIDALDLWLRDLVRGGFDGLPARGAAYWETPTARMVDAQARGLANQLQVMGQIPSTGAGWASALLERAGMLYLLLEGYRHQETLAPGLRADIRTLVGWNQKQDELLDQDASVVHDRWYVLSSRSYEEERLDIQRTWMRGLTTGKDALHLDFTLNSAPHDLRLPEGTCFEGDVVYYPSSFPQRVLLKERRIKPPDTVAGQTIPQAVAAYAEALSQQPWLPLFPMLLANVVPAHGDKGWSVRASDGCLLPLGTFVESGWKLLAVSGGHPLTVFGVWDGERLSALTAWVDGRIILI